MYWVLTLSAYLLALTSIFALTVVLLHRLINPGLGRPTNIILAICILVTIVAAFTYLAGPLTIYQLRTRRWQSEASRDMTRFFAIRMVFYAFTVVSAWLTYVAVLREGHEVALRWAFVLENTLLLTIMLTLFALRKAVSA